MKCLIYNHDFIIVAPPFYDDWSRNVKLRKISVATRHVLHVAAIMERSHAALLSKN